LWRWLSADALRPWRHRSWIFPRDPDFAAKAGRILDLYDRLWQGRPLNAREFVISADEKSSIEARRRKQPTLASVPGRSTRVEHEYFREGAWTYLAAWDVHRAKVFGRCEKKTGIAPVDRLIAEVMSQQPYRAPFERLANAAAAAVGVPAVEFPACRNQSMEMKLAGKGCAESDMISLNRRS
jgi:hypothetical protein